MIRWAARAGLLRFMGRKAIPVLVAFDALQLARSVMRARNRRRAASRDPVRSREGRTPERP